MPDVYDKEKTKGSLSSTEQDAIDDIESNYGQTASSAEEDQKSAAARNILGQEREAAKGNIGQKASGGAIGTTPGSSDTSKRDLKEKEQSTDSYKPNLFKPGADKAPSQPRKVRIPKRIRIAGLLVGLVGGGVGFVGFGVVSGPLQIIHAGELLKGFHLDETGSQGETRMLLIARNIRYFANGTPQKTRMGLLGNRIADNVERRYNNSGIRVDYDRTTGFYRGTLLDPATLPHKGIYANLPDRSPEALRKLLQETKSVATETRVGVVNNRPVLEVFINTQQPGYTYQTDLSIHQELGKTAGVRGVSAITGRVMTTRNGMFSKLHPIKKAQRAAGESFETRRAAWRANQVEKVNRGITPIVPGTETQKDSNGNPTPGAGEASSEIAQLEEEGGKAAAAHAAGDPGALAKFQSSLTAKYTGFGATAIGILCVVQYYFAHLDEINRARVIAPQVQMGLQKVSTADEIKSGHADLDGETDQLGWVAELMTNKETRRSWFDALSVRRELGQAGGVQIPQEARIDPEGNVATRAIAAIPGLTQVCQASATLLGGTIFFGLSVALTGSLIKPLAEAVLFTLALQIFIPFVASIFATPPVDPLSTGPDAGNHENYGVLHAANFQANSQAALPVSPENARLIGQITDELSEEDFRSKSLAYRLFDLHDPKTFIAQVIDSQSPDPGTNASRFANSFLNVGQLFSSSLIKPLLASVGAAPITPYDYGFPRYAYTPEEMNSPLYQNPFENANRAADVLDSAVGPEYVTRAKTCFGITLLKTAPVDLLPTDNPSARWGVAAPLEGEDPLLKTINDPANNCLDGSLNWTSVRFLMFDSQVMNAQACIMDNAQACVDVGQESSL